jgi:hypothetical protein
MFIYWLIFFIPAYLACTRLKSYPNKLNSYQINAWPLEWIFIYIFLIFFIGLRHEVGGDWINYLLLLESFDHYKNIKIFNFQDLAYVLLNRLAIETDFGIYLVNFLSAVIFCFGLITFCLAQPRPWLSLTVAIPYLVIVVSMGYTRQSAAIGIIMLAMLNLENRNLFRFIFLIFLASLFHKSALVILPFVFFNKNNKFFTIILLFLITILLYILILQESINSLIAGYITDHMQSNGAEIRIAMNAFPALLFIYYRKLFILSEAENSFWTWMSWFAIFLLILLIFYPSSTAIDRIALYWIPIQLFVFSRLPSVLVRKDRSKLVSIFLIILYCFIVQFTWIFYADTSFAWLPYQFYPLVSLWN